MKLTILNNRKQPSLPIVEFLHIFLVSDCIIKLVGDENLGSFRRLKSCIEFTT